MRLVVSGFVCAKILTRAYARKHGIAQVPRSHPAYRYMRDDDGVVCELLTARNARRGMIAHRSLIRDWWIAYGG